MTQPYHLRSQACTCDESDSLGSISDTESIASDTSEEQPNLEQGREQRLVRVLATRRRPS